MGGQRREDSSHKSKTHLSLAVLHGPGLWEPRKTSFWSEKASPLGDCCFCSGLGLNFSLSKNIERMWQEVAYRLYVYIFHWLNLFFFIALNTRAVLQALFETQDTYKSFLSSQQQ